MKPVALQVYTVRDEAEADLVSTLKRISEAGFKGVEPAGLYGHEPHDVRRIVEDLGMVVCSEHLGREMLGDANQIIERAQILGYDNPVISGDTPAFKSVDSIKASAEKFQAVAEALKPHGMRLGYHNHAREMAEFDGSYGLDIFLAAAPDITAQIDVYWAANFGAVDVPALIAKYAARVTTMHLKDGPLIKLAPQTPVGSGKMDIPACVAAADDDVLKWLIVELDYCQSSMMDAAAQSLKYLASAGVGEANPQP